MLPLQRIVCTNRKCHCVKIEVATHFSYGVFTSVQAVPKVLSNSLLQRLTTD